LHLELKNFDNVFKDRNFYFDGNWRSLSGVISIKMIRLAQSKRPVIHHVVDNVVNVDAKKVMLYIFFFTNFFKKEIQMFL